MLFMNEYSDKNDLEFFKPRNNSHPLFFEYIVALTGQSPASFDWKKYMGPSANQGATTLCTFYAINAVQEAIRTKFIRDAGEEWLMKMSDYKKWKRPSKIPERCVLDPFMSGICKAI